MRDVVNMQILKEELSEGLLWPYFSWLSEAQSFDLKGFVKDHPPYKSDGDKVSRWVEHYKKSGAWDTLRKEKLGQIESTFLVLLKKEQGTHLKRGVRDSLSSRH